MNGPQTRHKGRTDRPTDALMDKVADNDDNYGAIRVNQSPIDPTNCVIETLVILSLLLIKTTYCYFKKL